MQEHEIIIFGKHSAIAAINNKKRIIKTIFVSEDRKEEYQRIISRDLHSRIKICSAKTIAKICRDDLHQGIAVSALPLHHSKLDELIATQSSKSVVVILDRVSCPFNIGNILRSSYAFGVNFIITQKKNVPGEISSIAKSANGALEYVPICSVSNIASAILALQKNNYHCYALDGDGNTKISDIQFPERVAIVLGAEHEGIKPIVKKQCDEIIQIPMNKNPNFDSLNVSNAAAIVMFKIYSTQ